jgi:hypothetical protein
MSMEDDLNLSGEWLKINKIRYLLKLARSKDGNIEISPVEWPESGCQVELTQIWAEDNLQKWTSLGFEAFGGSFQNMKGKFDRFATFSFQIEKSLHFYFHLTIR